MPYSIVRDHEDCDGFGVVKDSDNKLMGCHETKAQAEKQITALNIADSEQDNNYLDNTENIDYIFIQFFFICKKEKSNN